jgi:UDP-2,4-diacetamido-2,4,6-trideoxy-beta-L-altropyranose hydrolase
MTSVVFRVDGGAQLGSGHVMRCLTLGRALRGRGAGVSFVCRAVPGHYAATIEAAGFRVVRLAAELSVQQDAEECARLLEREPSDWCIVDHYELDESWERAVGAAVERLGVIEDLESRAHRCDLLLDQNWFGSETESRYSLRVPAECTRLLGPRYTLLQPEYAELRADARERPRADRRVLVFFGGADRTQETHKALLALSAADFASLAVDVVLGASYPDRDGIVALASRRDGTTLHEGLPSLAPLMMSADCAIGAGGATTWERLCLGLPSHVTTLAPNQAAITAPLAAAGYVRWTGRSESTTPAAYEAALRAGAPPIAGLEPLVDGRGARRVAEAILPSPPTAYVLRRAVAADAADFLCWRNDALSRAMSFTSEPVSWSEHLRWFRRKLDDASAELYVVELDGLPVGQVRIDRLPGEAVLSFGLDPVVRGRGLGERAVADAVERVRRGRNVPVRADVKPENAASRRIFTKLGWTESRAPEGHVVFRTTRGIGS